MTYTIDDLKKISENVATAYSSFTYRGDSLPPSMLGGLLRYIEHGVPPGDFWQGVLEVDLRKMIDHADDTNINLIVPYYIFCYNELPSNFWGTAARVQRFLATHPRNKENEEA